MSVPVRTCIGCGQRSVQRELARLRILDGRLVADGVRSGRGAWVHLATQCLDRAASGKALGRAFRQSGIRADPGVLLELLTGNVCND